ncbi:Eukaryotic translation initiation factor IF4E [Pseudoloma neurophilia]|uniref:Eukaryotic translation initiation factor IF4E n=1 Tax=Pseudoloma neurophilia TaxID=146866 RepID=A0A0R0M1D1_9MICR|nr:Eukaryotic translation initiation factor IF4E [Pseudoloma neurophilia]
MATTELLYPTKTVWNMYYNLVQQKRNFGAESYSEILNEVCSIGTIPEMMYMIENMEPAIHWPLNSNLHFFREGIVPLWEDPMNAKGGKWVLEIPKSAGQSLNDLWNKTVMYVASEMIDLNKNITDSNKIICGCVFSPRKITDRIALWTKTTDDRALAIGKEWKAVLNTDLEMGFKIHENALKGIRERKNNLYVLN